MKMKLAEYNLEIGKFERFLELGEDFTFGGEFINIKPQYACGDNFFDKDKKDPLNRFNGLFNGRTYGKGRFVLIDDKKDLVSSAIFDIKNFDPKAHRVPYIFFEKNDPIKPKTFYFLSYKLGRFLNSNILNFEDEWLGYFKLNHVGNLHENPELWEKIK